MIVEFVLFQASVSTDDVISPLQGYKIVVTNLHPNVTQDDIIVSKSFNLFNPLPHDNTF